MIKMFNKIIIIIFIGIILFLFTKKTKMLVPSITVKKIIPKPQKRITFADELFTKKRGRGRGSRFDRELRGLK